MRIEMIERPLMVNKPLMVCTLFLKYNCITVSTATVDLQPQTRFLKSVLVSY